MAVPFLAECVGLYPCALDTIVLQNPLTSQERLAKIVYGRTLRTAVLRRRKGWPLVGEPLSLDPYRTGKAYTVSDAAHFGGVSSVTARRWILGDDSVSAVFGSNVGALDHEDRVRVSFLDLMEFIVALRFRRKTDDKPAVPLDRLRRAHQYAREHFGIPYPFASLKLWQDGVDILHAYEEQRPGPKILVLSLNGQLTLPNLVQREEQHIVFGDDTFALRWFPLGKDKPVVVDPRIAAGRPTVQGTGVTLGTIRARRDAGEPLEDIAGDYELDPASLGEILSFAA